MTPQDKKMDFRERASKIAESLLVAFKGETDRATLRQAIFSVESALLESRNEAIEDAAVVAENNNADDWQATCNGVATAIRQLKGR